MEFKVQLYTFNKMTMCYYYNLITLTVVCSGQKKVHMLVIKRN